MSIRVYYNVDYNVSETSAQNKELGLASPWTGTNDQQDDGGSWRQRIHAAAVNIPVDVSFLSNVAFLGIKVTGGSVTVKKNSTAGEPWTISPLGVGATDGFWLMSTTGITSLFLSSNSAVDVDVTIVVAGISA